MSAITPMLMAPDWPGCPDCANPDLAIITAVTSGTKTHAEVFVEVKNHGQTAATNFYVDAYVNQANWPGAGEYGGSYAWVSKLKPGEVIGFVLPIPRLLEPAPIPADLSGTTFYSLGIPSLDEEAAPLIADEPAPIPALVLRVDVDGWVKEAREGNNYLALAFDHNAIHHSSWKSVLTTKSAPCPSCGISAVDSPALCVQSAFDPAWAAWIPEGAVPATTEFQPAKACPANIGVPLINP